MKIDKIICTNKFKKSIQKLIRKNKKHKDEIKDVVHNLKNGKYSTKNARKHHELHGGYEGYEDIHFSKINNDLILVYKIRTDGSILLLEIQDVGDHKEIKRGYPSDRLVDYDEKEIFGESKNSLTFRQKQLIQIYQSLMRDSKNNETNDYDEAYLDGMYDVIHNFGLEKIFDVEDKLDL